MGQGLASNMHPNLYLPKLGDSEYLYNRNNKENLDMKTINMVKFIYKYHR